MLDCQAIKIFLSFVPTKKCRKAEDVSKINNDVIPRVNRMKKTQKNFFSLFNHHFKRRINLRWWCCNILEWHYNSVQVSDSVKMTGQIYVLKAPIEPWFKIKTKYNFILKI